MAARFEFDPEKSIANKDKHGIDFISAQALWEDPNAIKIKARTIDEARYIVIGKIAGKHWTAIITCRNDHVRIISVRRARKKEVQAYEK